MPSNSMAENSLIIEKLSKYQVKVLNMPKLSEIISDRSSLRELRELTPEDIIGREIVSINTKNLSNLKNKCICITGAGGSIGNELFRQLSF